MAGLSLLTSVLLLLVAFSGHLCEADDPECESGWLIRGDYCYKKFDDKINWYAAKNLCEEQGGGLVSITSEDENAFVFDKLGGGSEYWIGLTDAEYEGHFRWSDFAERGYEDWFNGGANSEDMDCVRSEGSHQAWVVEDCTKTVSYVCKKPSLKEITDYPEYWRKQAHETLEKAQQATKLNTNVAQNVIMFLGDGMSISTVTATRILKGQNAGKTGEETVLTYEAFPHVGLSKTYNTDFQVPDSAGTATAYLTGVKTKKGVIGLDARALEGVCSTAQGREVSSILKLAKDANMAVGFVTTTTITHASPAGLYAHVPNRRWEYDVQGSEGCDDIAKQFVHGGIDIDVAFGGGWENFKPEQDGGKRRDGKDLTVEWKDKYSGTGKVARYIESKEELNSLDLGTDYVLGLFNKTHMDFVDYGKHNEPTLTEMMEAAIKILSKNGRRFFLFVEGGRIDHGHHFNMARLALTEALQLEQAVTRALQLTDEKDTLTVVTSDHSHTMTITGYPPRGNPILGYTHHLNDLMYNDGIPYTTINYAIGPGGMKVAKSINETGMRPDPSKEGTEELPIDKNPEYIQSAVIGTFPATHEGGDVAIFANGPMSHLFHSVHEQNYIMHVMQYAACIGDYGSECH